LSVRNACKFYPGVCEANSKAKPQVSPSFSISDSFKPPFCQITVILISLEIRGFGFQSQTSCLLLPAASAIPPHPCGAFFLTRLSPWYYSRIASVQIPISSSFQ